MNDFEIIFVEFDRLPKYTKLNIERTKCLFPNVNITLITNLTNKANKLTEFCQVVEWDPLKYPQLVELDMYKNSGDKFWLHTMGRLFAICDYHLSSSLNSFLHLESDVILMENFPFGDLLKSQTLMWGKYNNDRDVASLFFSPTKDSSSQLLGLMEENLTKNSSLTDMSLLSEIALQLGPEHSYFPNFPAANSKMINIKSGIGENSIEKMTAQLDDFSGIFDHASIGMWFDGLDPVHTFGVRQSLFRESVESGDSFVDPTNFQYFFEKKFQLQFQENEKRISIYSLHIHSKSLSWFKLDNFACIRRKIQRINSGISRRQFDFHTFLRLVALNLRQGTLLSWCRHAFMKLSKNCLYR